MAASSELFLVTGIPGSGKTVLFSVLVLRYGDQFWPRNDSAQNFKLEADVLNQQQWPAATNPLAPQKAMQWDFTHNGKKSRWIVSDKAGEAWQTFVAENQDPGLASSSGKVTQVLQRLRAQLTPDQKKELETIESQFQQAACVCIMIDLSEDINCGKNNEQYKFVTAVMNYLEKIERKKCPIALVVTKCKTYGDENSWKSLFQKRYASIVEKHWEGGVKVIYTDAVADTVTNAACELIPAPNFSSCGLDDLLDWVSEQTCRAAVLKKIIKSCVIIIAGVLVLSILYTLDYALPLLVVITIIGGVFYSLRHKTKE